MKKPFYNYYDDEQDFFIAYKKIRAALLASDFDSVPELDKEHFLPSWFHLRTQTPENSPVRLAAAALDSEICEIYILLNGHADLRHREKNDFSSLSLSQNLFLIEQFKSRARRLAKVQNADDVIDTYVKMAEFFAIFGDDPLNKLIDALTRTARYVEREFPGEIKVLPAEIDYPLAEGVSEDFRGMMDEIDVSTRKIVEDARQRLQIMPIPIAVNNFLATLGKIRPPESGLF